MKLKSSLIIVLITAVCSAPTWVQGQVIRRVPRLFKAPLNAVYNSGVRKLPETPLSQDLLNLLVNEISGQVIFNNELILAGAPWIRGREELNENFSESNDIFEMVKEYGIKTIRLERFERKSKFTYPPGRKVMDRRTRAEAPGPPGFRCRTYCQWELVRRYHWLPDLYPPTDSERDRYF